MKIGNYTLANAEKVERALHGTVLSQGQLKGGVGDDADPADILAEYDRIGGRILMDGKYKVKLGCFFDFSTQKPFKKPKPILVFNIGGEFVEIDGTKPLPLEVQAAEQAETRKAAKRKAAMDKKAMSSKKKAAKKAAKNKASDDEANDEADENDADADEEEDGEAA